VNRHSINWRIILRHKFAQLYLTLQIAGWMRVKANFKLWRYKDLVREAGHVASCDNMFEKKLFDLRSGGVIHSCKLECELSPADRIKTRCEKDTAAWKKIYARKYWTLRINVISCLSFGMFAGAFNSSIEVSNVALPK